MPPLHNPRLELCDLFDTALSAEEFAGASWIVVQAGKVIHTGQVGNQGKPTDRIVGPDTLFDIASLTKPAATASSCLILMDQARIRPDDEVQRFLPADDRWKGVRLHHLLTHTSGLRPYLSVDCGVDDKNSIRERILESELQAAPGDRYQYSCPGYILLQAVIETVTGQCLDTFAAEKIYQPLEMADTLFKPGAEHRSRAASGGLCPHAARRVFAEPHDPLARAAGGVSGNAGLFSSARDLGRFGQAVLDCAAGRSTVPFSSHTALQMLTNQIDPAVGGHSYGFFTHPNMLLPRGDYLPLTTVGHTGFTGTSMVLVAELDLVIVLLTNCLYYRSDKMAFFRTRRVFHNLIAQWVQS